MGDQTELPVTGEIQEFNHLKPKVSEMKTFDDEIIGPHNLCSSGGGYRLIYASSSHLPAETSLLKPSGREAPRTTQEPEPS